MTMPERFQASRRKGWRKPSGGFVVTRGSRFGNPFRVKLKGDPASHADAVAEFRAWITAPEQAKLLEAARRELRGRDLGCFCPPELPCHADVLLELANE